MSATIEEIHSDHSDHEHDHDPVVDNGNAHYPPVPAVRPPTYYGEGEFDPPSSDDESDELMREKKVRIAQEAEQEGEGDRLNEDVELVIGGHKVEVPLCWLCAESGLMHELEIPKTIVRPLPGHLPCLSCYNSGRDWNLCCFFIYRDFIPGARNAAHDHGSCLQRNVQRSQSVRPLDTRR